MKKYSKPILRKKENILINGHSLLNHSGCGMCKIFK